MGVVPDVTDDKQKSQERRLHLQNTTTLVEPNKALPARAAVEQVSLSTGLAADLDRGFSSRSRLQVTTGVVAPPKRQPALRKPAGTFDKLHRQLNSSDYQIVPARSSRVFSHTTRHMPTPR